MHNVLMTDKYSKHFLKGIISYEDLPTQKIEDRPAFYVINTDVASGTGLHWVVISLYDNSPAEFFDSLGAAPETYAWKIRYFLEVNGPTFQYSTKRIQGSKPSCGYFCLSYIYFKCRGISLKAYINAFSDKRDENDTRVMNMSMSTI